jgi:hypothetical protein
VNAVVVSLSCSVAVVAAALAGYDRFVVRPSRLIGVVDLGEVYRAKEAEFARLLAQGASDEERRGALAVAQRFALRLPVALEELPHECRCLVVLRSAVAGATPDSVDLTGALMRKVEAP